MNRTDEADLAWALADSAAARLKPADRTLLCAKIGAGEPASAIRDLLAFYANTQAELPRELAERVLSWIQGYAASDSGRTLRRIYDRIIAPAANTSPSQPPEVKLSRSSHRLIAQRSRRAARGLPTRRSTSIVVCGVTTCIEDLFDNAVEARRVAQTAVEVAVREARSVEWSWDQISAALGGKPNEESLRRKFGSGEPTFGY
jgi:hypothetical protein